MDNVFKIIESTPNIIVMFTVSLGNKFNITVGKNYDNTFIYFNNLDKHIKYVGTFNSIEYKTFKQEILQLVNNTEIKYIEGYADITLKNTLSYYGFEYYNENSSYISLFKVFKYQ